MPSKSHANILKTAALAATALLLSFTGALHAQTLLVNLGPGSFSTNWGTPQDPGQYQRQEVKQRTYHARISTTAALRRDTYVGVDYPDSESSPPQASVEPQQPTSHDLPGYAGSEPTVPGRRAVLRHGVAYAPADAPLAVKRAIWAINTIRTKPYVWGGGHDSFFDPRGYDCSGTVSFALHYAGQLGSPTDSRSLRSFGEAGPGHWMTVYARDGHTWMVIAGLRLDTTGFYGNEGPRWRNDYRSPWGFTARHPVGL